MKRIGRSAIVEHAAEEMFALVDDVERYPEFLPWCSEARVEDAGEGLQRATLTVGLRGLRQSFTTLNENRPPQAIDMRLVEGPFRSFRAAWRFRTLSPRACAIEFSMEYEFASGTLGRLLEPLFEHIADTMVDAFKKRADAA
jgi:ribosome-associated toxin RatA of RatAB toxin-antitoxin module